MLSKIQHSVVTELLIFRDKNGGHTQKASIAQSQPQSAGQFQKKALCLGLGVCKDHPGQMKLVLGVKSALPDPFSMHAEGQEQGVAVTHMPSRPLPFPVQQARVLSPPWDTSPTRTGDCRWKGASQGKQVLIVWSIRTMAADSGEMGCDGQPLPDIFVKDTLCSVRVAKAVKWKLAATDGSPLKESLPLSKTITEENRAREWRDGFMASSSGHLEPTKPGSRCCPGPVRYRHCYEFAMAALSNHYKLVD